MTKAYRMGQWASERVRPNEYEYPFSTGSKEHAEWLAGFRGDECPVAQAGGDASSDDLLDAAKAVLRSDLEDEAMHDDQRHAMQLLRAAVTKATTASSVGTKRSEVHPSQSVETENNQTLENGK